MKLVNDKGYVKSLIKIKKGGEISEIELSKVIECYKNSFNKMHHAVCLGIDGTLVDENHIFSSEDVNDAIYRILMKRVPIIFITGRGEGSLKQFLNKLITCLKEKYLITEYECKRIMGIGNDGEILIYTSPNEDNELFNIVESITDIKKIDKLENIDKMLLDELEKEIDSGNVEIKYSHSKTIDKLMNIRILILKQEQEERIRKKVFSFLKGLSSDYENIFTVSRGVYLGVPVYQIGVSDKGIAVSKVEEFLGIPKNSTIRIGDSGDELGNDFMMLNCAQGFSVNTCSNNLYGCYPIVNENGEQIVNVDATLYILQNAKIYATLCLEKPNYKKYMLELAEAEKKISIGNHEIINKYNVLFSEMYDVKNGFSDIFDMKSGAVKFKDWEWVFIEETNPFKKLFSQKENYGGDLTEGEHFYKYMIHSDTARILRGPVCYYYFLSFKNDKIGVTRENLKEWQNNYTIFLNEVIIILDTYEIKQLYDLRMLIGILDNIRNLLLVVINSCIYKNYEENFAISFSTYKEDKELNKWYELAIKTYDFIYDFTFLHKDIAKKQSGLSDLVKNIRNEFEVYITLFLNSRKKIQPKSFRAYREIDNYIENHITLELSLEKIEEENENIANKMIFLFGVNYGGLELPLMSKRVFSLKGYDIFPSVVGRPTSLYTKDHAKDTEVLHETNTKLVFYGTSFNKNSYNILADDNVLSGKTLQVIINLFNESKHEIDDIIVVRYPSLNRIEQMFGDKPGAVDVSQFFSYIKGIIFKTPYSKIRSRNIYLDELLVFNKAKYRIAKYLFKNGLFDKHSEVSKTFRKQVRLSHILRKLYLRLFSPK